MNEELRQILVRDLGKYRSRGEIIRMVAEQGGTDWRREAQFILKVEQEHGRNIGRRQGTLKHAWRPRGQHTPDTQPRAGGRPGA